MHHRALLHRTEGRAGQGAVLLDSDMPLGDIAEMLSATEHGTLQRTVQKHRAVHPTDFRTAPRAAKPIDAVMTAAAEL